VLKSLKVKDTPKYQNTLLERRFMRGFEKKRETLIHTAALRRVTPVNKNRREHALLFMLK
jgi:hypothetical protein